MGRRSLTCDGRNPLGSVVAAGLFLPISTRTRSAAVGLLWPRPTETSNQPNRPDKPAFSALSRHLAMHPVRGNCPGTSTMPLLIVPDALMTQGCQWASIG
jgi:hypothetical protein